MRATCQAANVQQLLIEEPPSCLPEYGRIPISFDVTERFELVPIERATSLWTQAAEPSYVKDYDRVPGHRPAEWADRWDLSKWWFAAAVTDGARVGGAAVVIDTSEVEPLTEPATFAILWDIRVHPEHRRQGVGQRLIEFAEEHARRRGKRRMKIETQDVNVPACRFYARCGYELCGIDRLAYADFPDEARLVWQKQ